MYVKSIETVGFGSLPNGRREFENGFTVIMGPNEVGKSFTIEAVCQGLFGDGATTASQIRENCLKWQSTGQFFIKVEIVHDGDTYAITRDYENKNNILIKPDGEEVTDKRTIAKLVAEMIGLPSLKSFKATACMPQEEVEGVSDEYSTLREIIEGQIAGSGSDTDKLAKKINKARFTIRTKSGKKGTLVEIDSRIGAIKSELDEKSDRLDKLAENKKELAKVAAELTEISRELADKSEAYKYGRKCLG